VTKVQPTDNTQTPGTVLEQNPAADEEVERQTPVDLTVVANPEAVTIPDLEGKSVADAQAALLDLGLVPDGPTEEPSDTVDQGLVTRTDPASGQDVDPGSTVTIFTSSGPEQVTVPLVTCQSFGSAQKDLENAGLTPAISQDAVAINPQCPHGNKVAQQDPASGTTVDRGTTVTLFPGQESATGPTGTT
jgi:serine/threonine-protein kinase